MKRSITTTLVLTVVFVGLLVWNQIYENKIRPKQGEAEEKSKQLVTLTSDDIKELTVERMKNPPKSEGEEHSESTAAASANPEIETIQLKKVGSDWTIVRPLQDKADSTTVSSMVTTLTTTKQERVVDEKPKELDTFGLKTPWVKVTIGKDATTKPQVLLLGKDTPTGYSCYAKLDGNDAVYRVPKSLRANLDKDTKAVRNKDILSIPRAEVVEVEIQTPRENIVLKKDDKDNWSLARDNLPAESNEWTKTLNSILDAKATEFPSENAKDLGVYGLVKPEVKAWVKSQKAQARTGIWLGRVKGKDKEHVYVKREDNTVIFEVDKDVLTKASLPSTTYQNLRLANFARFDVKRIKLERPKNPIELLKEGTNWTLPGNPKVKIDSAKVDVLLAALQDIKVARFLPSSQKSGITQPELTVRLFEAKDKETKETEKVSLKFGARKGKEIFGERSDVTSAFALKLEDFARFNLEQKALEASEDKKPEETKQPEPKKAAEKEQKHSQSE